MCLGYEIHGGSKFIRQKGGVRWGARRETRGRSRARSGNTGGGERERVMVRGAPLPLETPVEGE